MCKPTLTSAISSERKISHCVPYIVPQEVHPAFPTSNPAAVGGSRALESGAIAGRQRAGSWQGAIKDMVTTYPPVRVVSPPEFDQGTAQTSGSVRLAAVAPQLGIESAVVGRTVRGQTGARTGIHHHGEQQTIAYVLSGVCEVRWGARGEYSASAKAGDFIMYLPSCRTWRSIDRTRNPFAGWSCGALQRRSSSTFRTICGRREPSGRRAVKRACR